MNRESLKFIAYKGLLEGNIDQDEYEIIVEKIGFFDQLKSGVEALLGDAEGGTFATRNFSSLTKKAVADLKADVDKIDKLADKLFSDQSQKDELKNQFVGMVVGALGVTPEKLQKAVKTENGAESSGVGEKKAQAAVKKGEPITPPESSSKPASETPEGKAVVALTAAVADVPQEKAEDDAKEKKLSTDVVMKTLYKVTAQSSKQSEDVTKKVVDYVFDKGLLSAGYIRTLDHKIRLMSESIVRHINGQTHLKRWNLLANVLSEASMQQLYNDARGGKISDVNEFRNALKSLDDSDQLDLLNNLKQQFLELGKIKNLDDATFDEAIKDTKKNLEKSEKENKLSGKGEKALEAVVKDVGVDANIARPIIAVLFKAAEEAAKQSA